MAGIPARFKRLFRLRFAVLYPLAVYLIFFTTPTVRSTMDGAFFMVAGMLIRLWSNGYAIKLDKLTTSGPYAYVRNPLYVGTGLILLGVVLMLQVFWVGVLTFAVLAVVYTRTIRQEQRMLADKFGKAFSDYCAKVPAMWPTLTPYAAGEKWAFSVGRVWESREHKVVIWMMVLVAAFHVKRIVMAEGGPADVKVFALVALACFLGLLDLAGECFRHWQKKAR